MDEPFVKDAKNGSQEALAQLLHSNYAMVFKYLIKFTFSYEVAQDLVQETMVRAIEKIEYYDETKAKFSTWLIAIAQNIYLDSLRKKKREQKYIHEDSQVLELYEPVFEHDDTLRLVLEAIGHLSEDVRFPVIMKQYYGYSYEEIAKKMSIPVGTVKSRIHNGLNAVRKELGLNG